MTSGLCPYCRTELVAQAKFCHACGVPLTGDRPRSAAGSAVKVGRVLIVFSYLAYLVAWIGTFDEPGIGALVGLVGLGLGCVMAGLGLATSWTSLGWQGLAHLGIYAVMFGLVLLNEWGPGSARTPFLMGGGLYLLATIGLSVHAWRRTPVTHSPWECRQCGYLLVGLTEPRCPECGKPFDPVMLPERTTVMGCSRDAPSDGFCRN